MEGMYGSSFDSFIFNSLCLVLKWDNINLIYPRLISYLDKDMMSTEEWHNIIFQDEGERVSYFADELLTRDRISLKDNLLAVGLPEAVLNYDGTKEIIVSKVQEALLSRGIDVPIINSSIRTFCDNEEEINKSKIKSLK